MDPVDGLADASAEAEYIAQIIAAYPYIQNQIGYCVQSVFQGTENVRPVSGMEEDGAFQNGHDIFMTMVCLLNIQRSLYISVCRVRRKFGQDITFYQIMCLFQTLCQVSDLLWIPDTDKEIGEKERGCGMKPAKCLQISDQHFFRLGDTIIIDGIFQTQCHGKMGAKTVFWQGMYDGRVIGGAV